MTGIQIAGLKRKGEIILLTLKNEEIHKNMAAEQAKN